MGSGDKKLEYESIRNYVLSLAQQRASRQEEEIPAEEKYSSEEWMNFMWEVQLGQYKIPASNAGYVAKWATWEGIAQAKARAKEQEQELRE
eukprot:9028173-Karenia_brevis.AAC.1